MARIPAFLADGWREMGRKWRRVRLRRRLVASGIERRQALTRLGQSAWESKVDLAAWPELRSRLEQLDVRAGDLSAAARQLDTQRTELDRQRQGEVQRLDALLAPARKAQSDADAALRAARTALADKDRTIRSIQARSAALAKEAAKPGDSSAPAVRGHTGEAAGTGSPEPRDDLELQRRALIEQAASETAARAQLVSEVEARHADSQRCAGETARLEAERKAVLNRIDGELDRLRQATAAAARDRAGVGRDQAARFLDLGVALYEHGDRDPALAASVEAVAAVDAQRATTQAAIDASLAQTGAMARGTMAKFGTTALLVPALLVAAGLGLQGRLGSSGAAGSSAASSAAKAPRASDGRVAADERRKDDAVSAFMKTRADPDRRKAGVEILATDVMMLGSSYDRSSLPLLLVILERGEPELRAAAAHAIGMLGPTAGEMPALVKALNDPMPAVREGVLQALGQASDPRAHLLVQRVRAAAADRTGSLDDRFTPTLAPDAGSLGTPLYPGATFLAFASDLGIGRAAFSSPDPVQKVVDFYAAPAPGRPPVDAREFTRLYFGGSTNDPTGVTAMNEQLQAWAQQAVAARMPEADMRAEYNRRLVRMTSLPLARYSDASLYGNPSFIALEVAPSEGATQVTRYVVVFQDHALGRTGIEHHVASEATRK